MQPKVNEYNLSPRASGPNLSDPKHIFRPKTSPALDFDKQLPIDHHQASSENSIEKQKNDDQYKSHEDAPVFNPKRPNIFVWLSENDENPKNSIGERFHFVSRYEQSFHESQSPLHSSNKDSSLNPPESSPRAFSNLITYLSKLLINRPVHYEDTFLDQDERLLLQAILCRKFPKAQKRL